MCTVCRSYWAFEHSGLNFEQRMGFCLRSQHRASVFLSHTSVCSHRASVTNTSGSCTGIVLKRLRTNGRCRAQLLLGRTSRCCSPLAARRAARRAPIQRNLPPQRPSHNSKPHTTTLPASCSRRWQTRRSHPVAAPASRWRLPLRRALAVAATASGINRRKKQLPQRRSLPSALGPSQLQRQRARK